MADRNNITSKTGRDSLVSRREPYWSRISKGCYLGYRRMTEGEGTWIARWRDDDGRQHHRALGHFSDFDDAQKAARAWCEQNSQGARPQSATVAAACEGYVGYLLLEKGKRSAADAEGRFKRLVYGNRIGRIVLDKLKTSDVRRWRDTRVVAADQDDGEELRRAKDTANRDLASLKAALNWAWMDGWVASDSGWKTVTPFEKAGARREHFLSGDDRKALLRECPDDLRLLATALLLTGARPGEIAALNASDFDRQLGTLSLSGKTGPRVVSLSTAAISFFTEQVKNRIGNAPMLSRADGVRWDKDAWKKPFKEAVRLASLPKDFVLYSLRHTAISELIAGGMDSFIVARLAGTSTTMIDKHYGHLRHDLTRAKLDAVKML